MSGSLSDSEGTFRGRYLLFPHPFESIRRAPDTKLELVTILPHMPMNLGVGRCCPRPCKGQNACIRFMRTTE
jgi:hypothetical protein